MPSLPGQPHDHLGLEHLGARLTAHAAPPARGSAGSPRRPEPSKRDHGNGSNTVPAALIPDADPWRRLRRRRRQGPFVF